MSITVILNAYRRPKTLQLQINSLLNQSIKPDQIWLWQNYHPDWDSSVLVNNLSFTGIDRHVMSNHNWKYLGRFSLAMLAQTEFVALFDDDTIPGPGWFKNCLDTITSTPNTVIGGVGLIHNNTTEYMNHSRVGWPSNNTDTKKVDLIGHAWFTARKHLKYLWYEDPVTMETAEDMHLCYTFQKYGSIQAIVPPHPVENKALHSSLFGYELGIDHTTPSVNSQSNFFSLRDYCLQEYCKRGWKLLCT